jgi:hypothetical protein
MTPALQKRWISSSSGEAAETSAREWHGRNLDVLAGFSINQVEVPLRQDWPCRKPDDRQLHQLVDRPAKISRNGLLFHL